MTRGIITVNDFIKAVNVFGFKSPVVTALWNTMENNPNNNKEFETVYAMRMAGRFDIYRDIDSGETYTYDELKKTYELFADEMKANGRGFNSFEDYFKHFLELGRHGVAGYVVVQSLLDDDKLVDKLYAWIGHDTEFVGHDIRHDYLSENTGRDGKDYLWHYDGTTNAIIDADGNICEDSDRINELFC